MTKILVAVLALSMIAGVALAFDSPITQGEIDVVPPSWNSERLIELLLLFYGCPGGTTIDPAPWSELRLFWR